MIKPTGMKWEKMDCDWALSDNGEHVGLVCMDKGYPHIVADGRSLIGPEEDGLAAAQKWLEEWRRIETKVERYRERLQARAGLIKP